MKRRMVLTGAAAGAAGLFPGAASAADTTAAAPTGSRIVGSCRGIGPVPRHHPGAFRPDLCGERRRPVLPHQRL